MSKSKSKSEVGESIKVVARCRPISSDEKKRGLRRQVEMDVPRGLIELTAIQDIYDIPRQFTFDAIYDEESKQRDLYDESIRGLIDSVLEGYSGTIFAYGQSGAGKTFTMRGNLDIPDLCGVVPNSFEHIFSYIQCSREEQFYLRVSYLRIYQEQIIDLLANDPQRCLKLKERPDIGAFVEGLLYTTIKNADDVKTLMKIGDTSYSTADNRRSRSHVILITTIESCIKAGVKAQGYTSVRQLNFVNLAGWVRNRGAERYKEVQGIFRTNLGLFTLGNVISALADGKGNKFVPYRDSKLTRLLQTSLGGHAKTVMVANISPVDDDETLSTLRYASRAKDIKNRPKINEDPKDSSLRQLLKEITQLRAELTERRRLRSLERRRNQSSRRSDESSEVDDEEDDPEAVEDYMNGLRRELDAERESIKRNASIPAEEERLLQELQTRQDQIEREQRTQEELKTQIRVMESKVLGGYGGPLEARTRENAEQLAKRLREIEEKKAAEEKLRRALDEEQAALMTAEVNYTSLQEEVAHKTKKLKILFRNVQQIKLELSDEQDEQRIERKELEEMQNELLRRIKKCQVIMDNFVPPCEREKLFKGLLFNDEDEEWYFPNPGDAITMGATIKRPTSAVGNRRPVSEYARRNAQKNGSVRFKGENVLLIELDLPQRTTREYDNPVVAPSYLQRLNEAMRDEEPLDIDCSSITSGRGARSARRASTASRDSDRCSEPDSSSQRGRDPTSRK